MSEDITKLKAEILALKTSRNAALSREKEANKNWSAAARNWDSERKSLQSELAAARSECQIALVDVLSISHQVVDLKAELAALKPQWISVEDRLPEQNTEVLSCDKNHRIYRSTYYEGRGFKLMFHRDCHRPVTHWQPLPPPPEAE